ncbi:MspA family porin [Gordonia sputi]|uniref:MspA family porin n=1 Tax=Gordonia sputi TaxID=36823 RepID=UPI002044A0E2|nr:MspA family porin [Gordonia sputi]MCM3895751.1 MspA family porin [Gordonia sputi]
MSKFSKLGRRGAAAVAVAAAAVIGATSMGAGHAEAAKLADGYKKAVAGDGTTVESWRKGEYFTRVGTVANNPISRGLAISGTYTVKTAAGVGGQVNVGYIVGCQVDISGIGLDLGTTFDFGGGGVTGSGSISLPIKPGEVANYSLSSVSISDKGVASLQVSDLQVILDKCGGYASARSYVSVYAAKGFDAKGGTLNTDGPLVKSTLYGQPFNVS